MTNERPNLLEMLTYRRPAFSVSEEVFIERFIVPIGAVPDEYGNYSLRIGKAPILWSSHTDTVHRKEGLQKLNVSEDGYITVLDSGCLGADCTAGVWLMLNMILDGIEGLYVFHRAEEIGGLGSSWIAKNTPELLEGIQIAVAFDRRGTNSVITHQGGVRCASDAFAEALAGVLNGEMEHGTFAPDDGGIFTDTDNYKELIPECTNLSVGYTDEHTKREKLDFWFLETLWEVIRGADFSSLPVVRNPADYEDLWDDYMADQNAEGFLPWYAQEPANGAGKKGGSYEYLRDTIVEHPDATADLLESYGLKAADILELVYGGSYGDNAKARVA